MKKVMVFAALVTLAAMTQAASMNWGADGLYNSQDAGYALGDGTMIRLIYLGDEEPVGSVTAFNSATGLTNLGGTIIDAVRMDVPPAVWGYIGTYGMAGTDVNGYWMVTFWDPKTPEYFGYYMDSLSGVPLAGAGDNVSIAIASLDVGMLPVPEPTAMALLALGATALGLRRRFRK